MAERPAAYNSFGARAEFTRKKQPPPHQVTPLQEWLCRISRIHYASGVVRTLSDPQRTAEHKGLSMRNVMKTVALSAAAVGLALSGAGVAAADSTATGTASNSPGFLSGNLIQVPVHVPVNVCGVSANLIGLLNPAFGNTCINS
jgi:hypothetical protein